MKNLKSKALLSLLIPCLLLQSGCSVTQQTLALDAAQIAVEGVIATLTVAGKIPPQYAPQVAAWADKATVAFGLTATELASSDTSAQKSLKIGVYWAATINAFSSLPPQVQAYITIAEGLIQAFLNLVAPTGATPNADGSVSYHGQGIPAFIRIGPGDASKLSKIHSRSIADLKTLQSLKY